MSNSILVNGNPFTMATTETVPIGIDFTNYLAGGDSVSSPVSALTTTTSGPNAGKTITLGNAPTINGNIVTQIVVGSQLAASNSYLLEIMVTLNTNKVMCGALQVNVPF